MQFVTLIGFTINISNSSTYCHSAELRCYEYSRAPGPFRSLVGGILRLRNMDRTNAYLIYLFYLIFVRKRTLHANDWRGAAAVAAAAAAAAAAFDYKRDSRRGLERHRAWWMQSMRTRPWFDELLVWHACLAQCGLCCVLILKEALVRTLANALTEGRLFSHQVKASRALQDQHLHERQVDRRRPSPPFVPFYDIFIAILSRLL